MCCLISVGSHSWPLSFVTLALELRATPRAVQAIAGHATLYLTMGVYARVTDRSKQQAIGAAGRSSLVAGRKQTEQMPACTSIHRVAASTIPHVPRCHVNRTGSTRLAVPADPAQ